MKKAFTTALLLASFTAAQAQLTTTASGTSVRARVSERVGLTDISIEYGRPAVKGREGKIWGDLVHTGFQDQGFGNGNPAPWRAGANENTIIEFGTDVTIEGRPLAAGKYGFFVAYGPDACTLIFSKATSSWGSYFYEPGEDVLRVQVKPVKLNELRERLTYQFGDETDSSATISLEWEKLAIPFKVSTALQQLQIASFERELRGEKGFDPHALQQMADYLQEHDIRLNDALTYIERAEQSIPTFGVLSSKADILRKLKKDAQADSVMKVAMERGTAQDVHSYARRLMATGKKQQAYEAFQQNYKRHPDAYLTCVGMARGCSAIGKTKDALKYANLALPKAPDAANKKIIEDIIAKLKEGKQI
ncbi:hypothetical protein GCM10023093_22460 [Nemorincola caseinilytica]|uniref:DUF2911 domain-containing protein n=1 Tax=Nemorincola caseinilytica TaxID=2054315 RepID=A0ABP8NK40_9BACT